jgi:hypothetical protein
MARSTKKRAESNEPEPPITYGEVTKDKPHGIEKVSDEHAEFLGQLRGFGGPGAAGATVAGPAVHVATEGGTKPLPVRDLPEGVETSGGAEPDIEDQPTSQAGALESGLEDNADNKHEASVEGAPAKEKKADEENAGGGEGEGEGEPRSRVQ